MKYAASFTPICQYRDRPDAACRNRPRCRRCGRALSFTERELCASCRDVRNLARLRFEAQVKNHIGGTATGPQALASGLNAVRVGVLAGLADRTIVRPLLDAVQPLARAEFRADLRAALRGMKSEEVKNV